MKRLLILAALLGTLIPGRAQTQQLESYREKLEFVQKSFEWAQKFTRGKWHMNHPQPVVQGDSTHSFDVLHYTLYLDLDPATQYAEGRVVIRCKSMEEGLHSIDLDLEDIGADSVRVSGNSAAFVQEHDELLIDLDKTYGLGEEFEVEVAYSGHPNPNRPGLFGGLGLFWTPRNTFTFVEPDGARRWFPCFDEPWDKATIDLNITVPANLVVASNGLLVGITEHPDEGKRTFHWSHQHPIATYLVAFAAADFATIIQWYTPTSGDSIPVMHFVYRPDSVLAYSSFQNTVDMMGFFSSVYGPYPFEKYGHMVAPIGGAMEHQTCTTIFEQAVNTQGEATSIVAHELAHQWWGDLVTLQDWRHIWLNEGFATYSEALYVDHLLAEDWYHRYMTLVMNAAMDGEDNFYRSRGRMPIFNPPPDQLFSGWAEYNKGGSVLHMLRGVMGDEKFFQVFPIYYERHKYSNASTADFRSVCEEVYGDNLGWFFDQWIFQAGYPIYRYAWSSEDLGSNQYRVSGFIDQIQEDAPVFKMPLELGVFTDAGYEVTELWVDEQGEQFELTVTGKPTSVVLDSTDWVLNRSVRIEGPLVVYHSSTVDDASGNGNARPDPGETVDVVVALQNLGVRAADVRATLSTNSDFINIASATANYGALDHLTPATNSAAPFRMTVDPLAIGHIAAFYLDITADGVATRDSFLLEIGEPSVLLVDDDGGADYEQYFHGQFNAGRVYAEDWNVEVAGIPGDEMNDYEAVIWFTGDDRQTTLTPEEQTALASYLDSGGKLLITGQDIGYDLAGEGAAADSAFYADYLHARLVADASGEYQTIGMAGDPIGDRLFVYLEGPFGGAGNQASPDVIEPLDGANRVLSYIPSFEPAAISYQDPAKGYRVVYLAFGAEGIAGPYEDSAVQLMRRSLAWLTCTGATSVEPRPAPVEVPATFTLEQSYPNPFAAGGPAAATIRFGLPVASQVSLTVFNVLGQEVRRLVSRDMPAGYQIFEWNGRDDAGRLVGGGVYFYRLEATAGQRGFEEIRKLVVVR